MDFLSACDEYDYESPYEAGSEDEERIKNEDDMLAMMSTFVEDVPDDYDEREFVNEEDSEEGAEEDMDDYDDGEYDYEY